MVRDRMINTRPIFMYTNIKEEDVYAILLVCKLSRLCQAWHNNWKGFNQYYIYFVRSDVQQIVKYLYIGFAMIDTMFLAYFVWSFASSLAMGLACFTILLVYILFRQTALAQVGSQLKDDKAMSIMFN